MERGVAGSLLIDVIARGTLMEIETGGGVAAAVVTEMAVGSVTIGRVPVIGIEIENVIGIAIGNETEIETETEIASA